MNRISNFRIELNIIFIFIANIYIYIKKQILLLIKKQKKIFIKDKYLNLYFYEYNLYYSIIIYKKYFFKCIKLFFNEIFF